MNVEIANRLMQYRKKAGLSQEELADKLGVSRQAVSKWECADSSPDTDNLIALAKIYGVSLDELVNGEEEPKVEQPKEEKKSGLHIDDGKGNTVHIEGLHVHVKDDKGSEVNVGPDGVEVIDKEDHVKVNKASVSFKPSKLLVIESVISGSLSLLCVIAYLLCGFLIKDGFGWRNYWVIFFLIPIIPSVFVAIRKRKVTLFNYPVFATACYLTVGMFLDIWHPTWIIFLTIPVFYTLFGGIQKALRKNKTVVIDNNNDDDDKDED